MEDKIVVLRGLSWSDYQRMLEVRGEASVPRFAYLYLDRPTASQAIREYRAALVASKR